MVKWEIKSYLVKAEPMSDEWWEREMKNATIMPTVEEFKKILEDVKNNVK